MIIKHNRSFPDSCRNVNHVHRTEKKKTLTLAKPQDYCCVVVVKTQYVTFFLLNGTGVFPHCFVNNYFCICLTERLVS